MLGGGARAGPATGNGLEARSSGERNPRGGAAMMPRLACPSKADLHRAITAGADEALAAHLAACARCAGRWRRLGLARDLARELPTASPTPAALEQLRTRLLVAQRASHIPRPRRAWLAWRAPALFVASAALATAVVFAWLVSHSPAVGTAAVDE